MFVGWPITYFTLPHVKRYNEENTLSALCSLKSRFSAGRSFLWTTKSNQQAYRESYFADMRNHLLSGTGYFSQFVLYRQVAGRANSYATFLFDYDIFSSRKNLA